MNLSPQPVRRVNARTPSPSGVHNNTRSTDRSHSHTANNHNAGTYLNPRNLELHRARRATEEHESIPLIDEGVNSNTMDNSNESIRETAVDGQPEVPSREAENNELGLNSNPNSLDNTDDRLSVDDLDGGRVHPTRSMVHYNGPLSPNIEEPGAFSDMEIGTFIAPESIPDVNVYQHKKTLAQGMMDLALFSANANQLRYVLDSETHPYYYSGIVLISISLIFQVAIGVGLIWNSRYNVKDEKQICIANKINNFTVIGIFLVTVINVFISAFGVASVQTLITPAAPVVNP